MLVIYARSDMYMNLDLGLCDLWAAKLKKWLWEECEGVYNGNGPNCGRRQSRQPTKGTGTGRISAGNRLVAQACLHVVIGA